MADHPDDPRDYEPYGIPPERKPMTKPEDNPNPPVVSESQVTYPSALNPQTQMSSEALAEADREARTRGAPVIKTATLTPVQPVNKPAQPDIGYRFDLEPGVAEPHGTCQLFRESPGKGMVMGFTLSPNCEPQKLIVGQYNKDWKDVKFPIPIEVGNFIIVIAKNLSDAPDLLGGNVYVKGPEVPAPAPGESTFAAARQNFQSSMSPQPAMTGAVEAVPAPAPVAVALPGGYVPPVPQQTHGPGAVSSGRSVTPGSNEVAICLARNDVRLLIEAAKLAVPDQNKWGIIRRLEDALR